MSQNGQAVVGAIPELPRLGFQAVGRRAERVLLVCGYDPHAPDESAQLAARVQRESAFAVTVVNAWGMAEDELVAIWTPSPMQPARQFDALLCCQPSARLPAGDWPRRFSGPKLTLRSGPGIPPEGMDGASSDAGADCAALDAAIESALAGRNAIRRPLWTSGIAGRNVLVLVHHRPQLDPRLAWLAGGAPPGFVVHQVGMRNTYDGQASTEVDVHGGLVQCLPRARYVAGELLHWRALARTAAAVAAVERLQWIERAAWLPEAEFSAICGSWTYGHRALELQWMLRYLLDLTAGLVRHASAMRNVDAIVAADVLVLPAAYLLGAMFGVPVVLDAHEYWPEADLAAAPFEQQFWRDFEQDLLPHAGLRMTVSSGLAAIMAQEYGAPFMVVPNAEPLSSRLPLAADRQARVACEFLLQGGFAPGRGFELLIKAWPRVTASAHLVLRGPEGEHRQQMIELARSTGLLDQRIFFPPAVAETELVASAAQADVGLLPYEPHGRNHLHCCPNKLSQYMAAGLPLLANRTEFVREVVEAAGAGLVVDFRDQDALVAAVNQLAHDAALRASLAARSRDYFTQSFHWEAVSAKFYGALSTLCGSGPARPLQWFGPETGVGDNSGFAAAHAAEVEAAAARLSGTLGRRIMLRLWKVTPGPVKQAVRSLLGRA